MGISLISTTRGSSLSDQMVDCAAEALRQIGFTVDDVQYSHEARRAVGFCLENHKRLVLPRNKLNLLYSSISWLMEAPWVDTVILKSIMGVWIWAATLRREQLSIPSALFRMLEKHYPGRVRWWPSALREMKWIRNLLPALHYTVSRSGGPLLFATDSEGAGEQSFGGFGVVCSEVSPAEWTQVLKAGAQPSFTVSKLDGSVAHLKDPLKELRARIPVPRIPEEVVAADRKWFPVASGRWIYREHIMLTEGRATNILLQKLAAQTDFHGQRVISLNDNLGWCAATQKGRSPAYSLNQQLRRRAALAIASDIQLLHPWVDTARMPADWLSRQV